MRRTCRKSFVRDEKIGRQIRRLVRRVVSRLKPDKVFLFGSFARGDYNEASDVDLLVVGDFQGRFFDRIGKVLELNDTSLSVEPLVYTREEFEKMLRNKNPFLSHVLKEAVALV